MASVDLVEGMAELKQAELGFREGVAVFRAAGRMTRRTLDILT
jgi:flagellar basal body rod protein FlgC